MEGTELKATYLGTNILGQEVERSLGRDETAKANLRISKFLGLPALQPLRDQWAETALDENWEEEFNAFALQFYPGPRRDEKFFPAQTKAMLRRMQGMPRSTDVPGKQLSRFDILRDFYRLGGAN